MLNEDMVRTKKISKEDITNIIKQIKDNIDKLSIYNVFGFREEDEIEIAKHLSSAINSKYREDKLDNLICVISYCGAVFPIMIIGTLYSQKKLNKNEYDSLLECVDAAHILYDIKTHLY